jgi:hypothetical protein
MDYKLTPSFGRRKARKLRDQSQKAYTDLLPLVKIDQPEKPFEADAKLLTHLSPEDYHRTRIWHEEIFLRILKLRGCLAFFHATEQVLQRS